MVFTLQCSVRGSTLTRMLKLFLIIGVLTVVQLCGAQDKMAGRGKWQVLNIARCPEDSQFTIKVDIDRHKCGRTKDCFNAQISLDREVGLMMGVRVDICKVVDGGACQAYQTISDSSMVEFVKSNAENNMEAAFTLAGLDPPDFPLPIGDLNIEEYPFDFCEMSEQAVYGEFIAKLYMIENSQDIACVSFHVEFFEIEDDVQCEDVE